MTSLEKDSLNGYNNQTGTILRKMFQCLWNIYFWCTSFLDEPGKCIMLYFRKCIQKCILNVYKREKGEWDGIGKPIVEYNILMVFLRPSPFDVI